MGEKKDDDIWGLLAGLFIGAVGIAILSSLTNPKCPNCKNPVKKGDPYCPVCSTLLEWK
jgi:predicted amidophosphoribosyltransferase